MRSVWKLNFHRGVLVMWLVRLCTMLALVAALLLPPGFARDCCCTRRAAMERAASTSVRPCCRAKAAAVARVTAAERAASRPTVKYPPCRCRVTASTVAVLGSKPRATIGSDWLINELPRGTELITRWDSPASLDGSALQGYYQVGPPLRKTLCRWMI